MRHLTLLSVALWAFASSLAFAQVTVHEFETLPITEVYIFKDGHAVVTRQGVVTLDPRGRARLGGVPRPLLGSFWPKVQTKGLRLRSVTAQRVPVVGKASAPVLDLVVEGESLGKSKEVEVSLTWVEKGLSWSPSYHLDTDGKGKAMATLRATLVNDLADLKDSDVKLVAGIPSFSFADMIDPISLETVVQKTRHQRRYPRVGRSGGQSMGGGTPPGPGPGPGSPSTSVFSEVRGAELDELYIYELGKLDLSRGARMNHHISEVEMEYKEVYVVNFALRGPEKVTKRLNSEQRSGSERFNIAEHRLRFLNEGPAPLTTAPTMILRSGLVLGQSLMTYTPAKSKVDVLLTEALKIEAEYTEEEVERVSSKRNVSGRRYEEVRSRGVIRVQNHFAHSVRLEVSKQFVGSLDRAEGSEGSRQLSVFELRTLSHRSQYDAWRRRYRWPYWAMQLNGITEVRWSLELNPGEDRELEVTWHHHWRKI